MHIFMHTILKGERVSDNDWRASLLLLQLFLAVEHHHNNVTSSNVLPLQAFLHQQQSMLAQ